MVFFSLTKVDPKAFSDPNCNDPLIIAMVQQAEQAFAERQAQHEEDLRRRAADQKDDESDSGPLKPGYYRDQSGMKLWDDALYSEHVQRKWRQTRGFVPEPESDNEDEQSQAKEQERTQKETNESEVIKCLS